jgi:hypothetical protein
MAVLAGLSLATFAAAPVLACSPLENPTIRALGPNQLVVVGRVGEQVPGGRAFHVERWFNGAQPATPILIAFKEGEPVGDCSYPVTTGEVKIIAPYLAADGRLSADLSTLQADPSTDLGRAYITEATALFGPGIIPPPAALAEDPPDATISAPPSPDVAVWVGALGVAVAVLFAVVLLLARRQRDPG